MSLRALVSGHTRLPPSEPKERRTLTTYTYATGSAAKVAARLLIVPVFAGPEPGPGVKELGLAAAYAAARLKGKRGEDLLVIRRAGDRFAADAVLMVGVGAREDLTVDDVRRTMGRVAGTARRFGTVATTLPQALSARHAVEAVTATVEGLALGSYRFDRYLSKKAEGGVSKLTVLGGPRWDEKAMKAAVRRTRRGSWIRWRGRATS